MKCPSRGYATDSWPQCAGIKPCGYKSCGYKIMRASNHAGIKLNGHKNKKHGYLNNSWTITTETNHFLCTVVCNWCTSLLINRRHFESYCIYLPLKTEKDECSSSLRSFIIQAVNSRAWLQKHVYDSVVFPYNWENIKYFLTRTSV